MSAVLALDGRARDLGGFGVRRVLPASARQLVGPFIFFDHIGPARFAPGAGLDVRPHPHIGLATVTYLFDGEIVHRDSLGFHQPIRPGDINWMTAGRGIAHSERTAPAERSRGAALHGLQLWVALPREHEEIEPSFRHYPGSTLPELVVGDVRCRVLAGTAWGVTSPVATLSPLFYAEATLHSGGELALPDDHEERAVYVADGEVTIGAATATIGRMLVFAPGPQAPLVSARGARIALIGGAPLDGERHLYWNFVSSSRSRIEQAKAEWRSGRFEKVVGDETEFIPLPPE